MRSIGSRILRYPEKAASEAERMAESPRNETVYSNTSWSRRLPPCKGQPARPRPADTQPVCTRRGRKTRFQKAALLGPPEEEEIRTSAGRGLLVANRAVSDSAKPAMKPPSTRFTIDTKEGVQGKGGRSLPHSGIRL